MHCHPYLSQFSEAGGCSCKLNPSSLWKILQNTDSFHNENIIIDHRTADDCAVFNNQNDEYLLFTTDFFTPFVDDPKTFGGITASHALSDIYAMGGNPLFANAILGFPPEKISESDISQMTIAAQKILHQHGCLVVGGHTIINPQPIYGFSIVGKVAKKNLKTNGGAQNGDVLILTKPLGTGILANALKLGLLSEELYQPLINLLLEVNAVGADIGELSFVTSMTDVTGFGLLGHALEMAENSSLMLALDANKIDFLPGTQELLEPVISPESGILKNLKALEEKIQFIGSFSRLQKALFCDPQTNGGLLISVNPNDVIEVLSLLKTKLHRTCKVIGTFSKHQPGTHHVILKNT